MRIQSIIPLACIVAASAACSQQQPPQPQPLQKVEQPTITIDQSTFCPVDSPDPNLVMKKCKTGQKVLFKPSRWGNEQLPVIFAAAYCDLRFGVVLTTGAVTCIYLPIGEEVGQEEGAAPQANENSQPSASAKK